MKKPNAVVINTSVVILGLVNSQYADRRCQNMRVISSEIDFEIIKDKKMY